MDYQKNFSISKPPASRDHEDMVKKEFWRDRNTARELLHIESQRAHKGSRAHEQEKM
jgi:hypothetical protein